MLELADPLRSWPSVAEQQKRLQDLAALTTNPARDIADRIKANFPDYDHLLRQAEHTALASAVQAKDPERRRLRNVADVGTRVGNGVVANIHYRYCTLSTYFYHKYLWIL